MKKLIYIFIPILAILLMSHNTYALNNQLLGDSWYLYRQTSGNPFCAQNSSSPEARRTSQASPWNINNGEYSWWSCVDSDSAYSTINASQGDVIVVELNTDYELSPYWYNTSARYLFSSYSRNIQTIYYATDGFNTSVEFGWTYNSEMNGVSNTLFRIQSINIYKPKGQTDYTQALNDIKNNLPSASDIGDAVNAPEEEATSNIENQSTSTTPAPDTTAATNIIGNISGIFTQIGNIPVSSTCSIAANFGNLNLGDINLCSGKENLPFVVTFGAYAFEVIFAINIGIILVKQVLGLFDWDRK